MSKHRHKPGRSVPPPPPTPPRPCGSRWRVAAERAGAGIDAAPAFEARGDGASVLDEEPVRSTVAR